MLEKWAIYARVSTEREQQKTSVPNQIQYCTKWIIDNSGLVYDTYIDDGISGKSMLIRPDVQRLLRDAENGKIKGVVFNNISRFGRDSFDLLWMKRKIVDEWGCRMVSLEQGWDSDKDPDELLFVIHAGMSQFQRKNLSRQIKHNCVEKVKRGEYPLPIPPLGYKRPRKTMKEDGTLVRPESYRLQIDDNTAPIIRGIFELAAKGYGSHAICKALTNGDPPFIAPIPPLNGAKRWYVQKVLGILRNPVYIGTIVFNKGTGTGGNKKNDKSDWIILENAHDPIVSQELFDQVQGILERRLGNHSMTSSHSLMLGITRCGVCGYAMRHEKRNALSSRKNNTYREYEYYKCAHELMDTTLPKQKVVSIRKEILDELVLQRIEHAYLNPSVIDTMVNSKRQLLEAAADNSQGEIKRIDKELSKIDRSFRKDLELFRAEAISISTFKTLQEENERAKEQLNRRKAQLQQASVLQESLDSRVQHVKTRLANYANIDKSDHAALKTFLTEVIEKVVVHSPKQVEIHYRELMPTF